MDLGFIIETTRNYCCYCHKYLLARIAPLRGSKPSEPLCRTALMLVILITRANNELIRVDVDS